MRITLLGEPVAPILRSPSSELRFGHEDTGERAPIRHAGFSLLWIADYCCTVICVPACVVKPLYIATVAWSPLPSDGGTTTLN